MYALLYVLVVPTLHLLCILISSLLSTFCRHKVESGWSVFSRLKRCVQVHSEILILCSKVWKLQLAKVVSVSSSMWSSGFMEAHCVCHTCGCRWQDEKEREQRRLQYFLLPFEDLWCQRTGSVSQPMRDKNPLGTFPMFETLQVQYSQTLWATQGC